MTEISDDSSQPNSGYSPTVGERLRLAREAKKVTISEVVAQLRLMKENIVYLESDQWDKLHGRPYARGYFSSYVNFLGLPHAEMLALFNMEYTSKEPSIDGFKRSGNNDQNGAGSAWFKSLLLIILLAAAWFAYQYWLEMQEKTQPSDATIGSISPDSDNEKIINDSFSTSIVERLPTVENEPLNFAEAEEISATSAVEEPVIEQQITELEVPVPNELADTDEQEVIEELKLVQPIKQSQLESNQISAFNISEPEIATEIKMLIMQFSEDCWVEITDRNNKKLLHKIVLADETVELTGDWPLRVLLGNAAAVVVRYNNAEFDIASHIRSNVARFSVGEPTE